jgi:hypothetical protein
MPLGAWKDTRGLQPVKLEGCHMTFTVLLRCKTHQKYKRGKKSRKTKKK